MTRRVQDDAEYAGDAGPLFAAPKPDVKPWREVEGRIEAQFEKFHRQNPHMFVLFERLALEERASGKQYCTAAHIFERMRLETAATSKGEPFRVNNNYKPLYARMFMREHPELDGFFRTRSLGEKNQWIDDDSPTSEEPQ